MFTAGCDSVKRIFFLSALLYLRRSWGACDGGTGTKARQGTLKKARYNAQCQETIRVTKPCTPKTKAKAKAKKGKGKD
uniref:Midkine n=1 Tax=Neovison vison TaxID=452646 RepID=A0A8C7B754_NEOVI